MISAAAADNSDVRDELRYQDAVLPAVSRTFALTIPQLPEALRLAVTNAYLLCRIADAIEDDAGLARDEKRRLHAELVTVVTGDASAEAFARDAYARLTASTEDAERDLVRNAARVVAVTDSLNAEQRAALLRCVTRMCEGMPRFQQGDTSAGVATLADMELYCYYVAGTVGEMLTALFCDYSPHIARHRDAMGALAASFGQGLQITNILKDVWEDHERGFCWLPRDVFDAAGYDLRELSPGRNRQAFNAGTRVLAGVAHGHLRNALQYSLYVPADEPGIRKFCLWSVGLAVLTLRRILSRPDYTAGAEVKVSRRTVAGTVLATRLSVRHDRLVRALFERAARGLPPAARPTLEPDTTADASPPAAAHAEEGCAPAQGAAPVKRDATAAGAGVEPRLAAAIEQAQAALKAEQQPDGHWCYELEADCTIPAEYILMMHFMDERDASLQTKIARYLRVRQNEAGGWPLYHGGDTDISCTIKAYYALKLAGDDPDAAHMVRARSAILTRGGAREANIFTRIALAQFGQLPWDAVPFMPVEVMLLPRWFFFHVGKVSYWSRTVMVPLFILCTWRVQARNPLDIGIPELFVRTPEQERGWFRPRSRMNRVYLALDQLGRRIEPFIPGALRRRAIAKAEAWFTERLNGLSGLGAIFPAMVNAYEALDALGYPPEHPLRRTAREALDELVVEREDDAYCQPCVSPVWDTALAAHALIEAGGGDDSEVGRALDWLTTRQITETVGDWATQRAHPAPGGWAFQYRNDHYPDLDDTAMVAWAMDRVGDHGRYAEPVGRAAQWLRGLQSSNGGFAAFDADNTHYHLNEIPFADHGALLDPPTADVSARVLALLGRLERAEASAVAGRTLAYLLAEQEPEGPWFGRWGTNYIYGTWSVVTALRQSGYDMARPEIRRAAAWLKACQRADGGWGEANDTYEDARADADSIRRSNHGSTAFQTAWAVLALIDAGDGDSPEVERGVRFLIDRQQRDGLWSDPWHTAPGFPRVFYLKYHGYTRHFPLWALARYRNELGASIELERSRFRDA